MYKNQTLATLIELSDTPTLDAVAASAGINKRSLRLLLDLTIVPLSPTGKINSTITKLATHFNVLPEDLHPDLMQTWESTGLHDSLDYIDDCDSFPATVPSDPMWEHDKDKISVATIIGCTRAPKLLSDIGTLYFEKEFTRREISEIYGLSASGVRRLLNNMLYYCRKDEAIVRQASGSYMRDLRFSGREQVAESDLYASDSESVLVPIFGPIERVVNYFFKNHKFESGLEELIELWDEVVRENPCRNTSWVARYDALEKKLFELHKKMQPVDPHPAFQRPVWVLGRLILRPALQRPMPSFNGWVLGPLIEEVKRIRHILRIETYRQTENRLHLAKAC